MMIRINLNYCGRSSLKFCGKADEWRETNVLNFSFFLYSFHFLFLVPEYLYGSMFCQLKNCLLEWSKGKWERVKEEEEEEKKNEKKN